MQRHQFFESITVHQNFGKQVDPFDPEWEFEQTKPIFLPFP